MVHVASFLGAVLFAGVASALPRPDSAIGDEVAVSAPNGVILSDTAALASASAAAAASGAATASASLTSSASSSSATGSDSPMGYGGSYASSSVVMATQSMDSSYGGNYNPPSWTYSAPPSMQTYGSGYNSWGWGGSGYDSCVSQCIASFGAPPATYTPPPYSGSQSSGNNHTVIVAPMQGVLKFVPAAVPAQPGDTIHYVWMANNHTVTKSSQLLPCNKTSDHPFASGTQNKPFTFDETVNNTDPVFFYCGTPGHCEAGMWGVINPTIANNSNNSISSMMPMMIGNDSSLSAMWSYMNAMGSQYNASSSVMNWGGSYDVSSIPQWAQGEYMSNVMYTRIFLAMNPEVLGADGKIDMTGAQAPLKFPADNANPIVNNAASSSNAASTDSASATPAASSGSSSSASASPSATGTSNGAASTAVSSALLTAAILAVSYLAL